MRAIVKVNSPMSCAEWSMPFAAKFKHDHQSRQESRSGGVLHFEADVIHHIGYK
jgi:hypothetical protein